MGPEPPRHLGPPGSVYAATGLVCGFFGLVVAVALIESRHYPARALSGETSVGTWLSCALLIAAAVLALVAGMRRGLTPWSLYALFFAFLALDERFMFHEQAKMRIQFGYPGVPAAWRWFDELPVLLGAVAGALVALHLWKRMGRRGRMLLGCAAVLGSASVAMDVLHAGAMPEDGFKLLAELALVCGLLGET